MDIEIESKTVIKTEAFVEDNVFKTHRCNIGDWYGDKICNSISIDGELRDINIINGKYEITIIIERK